MCEMIELDNELSAALLRNGLLKYEQTQTFTNGSSHTQMVQCNVESFNRDWTGGTTKQIVRHEIK